MYVCMYVYKYSVHYIIFIERLLIGLLFLFCPPPPPPPLYFVFENSKNTRNELTRPKMGTIFLVSYVFLIDYKKMERRTSLAGT